MQDHLLEVLKPGLAERAFSDGEYLIRQGDQGTHLLYIVEGSAEVLLKLSNPRIAEHHRCGTQHSMCMATLLMNICTSRRIISEL